MALLTVHTFPDPVLKQKALPVDEFDDKLSELAENMLETMYEERGIGLAAVQVAVHYINMNHVCSCRFKFLYIFFQIAEIGRRMSCCRNAF